MKHIKSFQSRFLSIISAVAVFLISFLSFNGFNTDASYSESEQYHIYNAQTGAYKSSYFLSRTAFDSIDTQSSVGTTLPRNPIEPVEKGIVKLKTTNYENWTTGFVVGKHEIATAAHCVHNSIIENILLFNTDGSVALTITDAVEYHVPALYVPRHSQFDYAVIVVNQDLSDRMTFEFGMMTDSFANNGNNSVTITGFPYQLYDDERKDNPNHEGNSDYVGGTPVNDNNVHTMYTGSGNVQPFDANDKTKNLIKYAVRTSSGNSGSPVYITETFKGQTRNYVIGIHINGYGKPSITNNATRITPAELAFYNSNPYLP